MKILLEISTTEKCADQEIGAPGVAPLRDSDPMRLERIAETDDFHSLWQALLLRQ